MDTIIERSEEFAETGITRFKRWELKAWFGAERLGKNVWRNIDENIKDKAPNAEIDVFENGNEFIMLDRTRVRDLEDWK